MNIDYQAEEFLLCVKVEPKTIYIQQIAITILIVDDSPPVVANIKELLEDVEGIASIESCGTYTEATQMLCTYKPAVVLVDINLPDKNGIVLLKYIKSWYPEIGVIMVTNQNENFYKNLCLALGALFFLDKSNDFEKLPAIVASVFR